MPLRLLVTLFLFWPVASQALEPILLNGDQVSVNIIPVSDYRTSSENAEFLRQVIDPNRRQEFAPLHDALLKHTQFNRPIWIKTELHNQTAEPIDLVLQLHSPFLGRAELHTLKGSNTGKVALTGGGLAFSERDIRLPTFALPFVAEPGRQVIYLKLSAPVPANVTLRLTDSAQALASLGRQLQIKSTLMAWFGALVVINFILFAVIRKAITLPACVMSLGILLNLAGWQNMASSLVTFLPWVDIAAVNIGGLLTVVGLAWSSLAVSSVQIKHQWRRELLLWWARLLVVFCVFAFLPVTTQILPAMALISPLSVGLLGLYWHALRTNDTLNKPAFAGVLVGAAFLVVNALSIGGIFETTVLVHVTLTVLGLASTMLISWACWPLGQRAAISTGGENFSLGEAHWPLLRKLNHEIRGPINGVMGMAELLQDTTLSAHQHDYVNTIQTAGFSLLREADQLQNLIRIGLDRLPETEEEFDLFDLLEDTLAPFSRIAHNKQLELILDVHPSVPERMICNAHLLAQILCNLLDNALKFTESGEIVLQVKLMPGHRIQFSVKDTGPGISRDARSHVFRFADHKRSPQLQPKDVHLGLPIARHIAGMLGGHLSVNSELRVGTTLKLNVPLTVGTSSIQPVSQEDYIPFNELRLMVLDDNLTCRKMIEHLAFSWGANILSMSNPQSAMANLHNQYHKAEPIDVLVLDQNMPAMTGMELAGRIRQDASVNNDIVIIMMTGADDLTADFKSNDFGVQYILSKPISARALQKTIQSAMPRIKENRGKNHGKKSYFF